ncbi:LPS assembly lipoprotein LptE [Marinobacterium aestuariivivens]|uniref:LPS-assembly lipoprotein LptE n=1 Tax=Marinobacterium aestuariivivens TaxID=1698799 RepID=A0ABW1ZY10_9GAMM
MTVRLRYLLLVLVALLAGCGFQLRGAAGVPESLRELELVMPAGRSVLRTELGRTLRSSGIELVDSAAQRLEILEEKQGRRTATLTGDIKADEYELRTEVHFQVSRGDQLLIPPSVARTERVYTHDASALTAKNEQEALLRREMQQDIARQILRRYLAAGTPSASP